MTWIKPSFTWMMYRSGWGREDAGQACVLGIDIRRDGFEWALAHAHLAHRETDTGSGQAPSSDHPVRVQWDPERDVRRAPLHALRSIQIGLRGEAVERHLDQWIVRIEDVTPLARQVEAAVKRGEFDEASSLLPVESHYPHHAGLRKRIEADDVGATD